jgi:hypothetical protein
MSERRSSHATQSPKLKVTAADINSAKLKLDELQATAEPEDWQLELTDDARKAIAQQMTKPRTIARLEAVVSELEKEKAATPETRGRKRDSLRILRQNEIAVADSKGIDAIEHFDLKGIRVLPSWMKYVKTWTQASVHPKLRSQVPKELSALRRDAKRRASA